MESQMNGQATKTSSRGYCSAILTVVAMLCLSETQVATADSAPERSLTLPREFQRRSLTPVLSAELAEQLSTRIGALYNVKLNDGERLAAADQVRELLGNSALSDFRSSVNRRIDLITAGIRAEQNESLSAEDLAAIKTIILSANRFEDTCSAVDADAVRSAWLQLKPNTEVIAILRPVFMSHYFNHNMHVTLSEHMLSRFVSDYQTRNGTIAECILGAWVTGSQVSNANVSADIKRSTGSGHFLLQLNGRTSSNTQGRKKPATIFTRGNHTFLIDAPVFFNGETLSTGQASINVNTNNQTVGVKTDLDWIPLIGSIVRKIAREKAQEKRGQSEYIAAQKIANRALPEFVKEVNERFSKVNTAIQQDLFAGPNNKGVGPDSISSRSSESHLAVSSRTMGAARLGGTAQPFGPLPLRGIAIQLHETAINNFIDGLELNGRSIREDQFEDEISRSLSELLQRDIKLGDSANTAVADESSDSEPPATFVFDENDPIRVRIEQDSVVLVLQIKIEEEGKDALPKHRIEVPIGIAINGTDIVLSPPEKLTTIRANALEPVSTLKRAGIANQIRRIVVARLPERKIDGGVSVAASDTKNINLQTYFISSSDGWLNIELQ
jgi:hypothetical protein